MIGSFAKPRCLAAAVLILAFTLSACADAATPTEISTPQPTLTPTAAPTLSSTSVAPDANATDEACPPFDGDARASLRQIEDQVSQLRGLQILHAVGRDLLTPAQLREHVEQDFLGDYSPDEARRDAHLLSLLGLVEPDIDLHGLYVDLLSEQVAGFYDSQEEQMLVVCGTGFGAVETFTYVHEFVHALQDQTYDLEAGLNFTDEACELDGERCFALRALIEGDASLLQEQWLRTYADEDMLQSLLASLGSLDSPVLDSAPAYIQAELLFPYLGGLSFARSLYLDGGWAAVDAAFSEPPLSSEQILHPERYPRDNPIQLNAPPNAADLPGGWQLTLQDVLGEWGTLQVLLSDLDEQSAQRASSGWGGDLVFLLENASADEAALVLVTQWDTMRDAHEFSAGFFDFAENRFGEPAHRDLVEATWVFDRGSSHFLRQSNQTRWIIAPDGETLSMLQSEFDMPLVVAK